MKTDPLIKLDFNNVLIKPKRSELTSRSQDELTRTSDTSFGDMDISVIPF